MVVKIKKRMSLDIFYRLQVLIFKAYGLWQLDKDCHPRWHSLYGIYFYIAFILWLLLMHILVAIQLVINMSNLNELLKVVFIFGTMLAVFIKFCNIKWKLPQYLQLIEHLQSKLFLPRCPVEASLLEEAQHSSRKTRNFYGWLSFCSLNTMQLSQFNLTNMQLPIPVYHPFDLDSIWRYVLFYFYLYSCISAYCYLNIAFDSLSASLLIFVRGQLNILAYRLRNVGRRDSRNESINRELKDCFKFYNEIEKLAIMIENLISGPLSVQIVCSVAVLVANFYALAFFAAPNDYVYVLKFIIYQLCMMVQVFIFCYFGGEITLASQKMLSSIYEADWVGWSKENRKVMLLMMLRFQHAIHLKAVNRCYSINLEAFSSIVNTSYSYFALLKRMDST